MRVWWFITLSTQFAMAMRVTASLGAYMNPAMCMFMVMSRGATMNWSRMLAVVCSLMPSRFPAIDMCMYRYASMYSPCSCVCSPITPIGACPSGREDVHSYWARVGMAVASTAARRQKQLLICMIIPLSLRSCVLRRSAGERRAGENRVRSGYARETPAGCRPFRLPCVHDQRAHEHTVFIARGAGPRDAPMGQERGGALAKGRRYGVRSAAGALEACDTRTDSGQTGDNPRTRTGIGAGGPPEVGHSPAQVQGGAWGSWWPEP